ncbi:MAG TPA: DUF1080 domain-containing protein [Pirellulales bacterium]|jgi:hypothetical protein|nr:DUF1080 domain-containing protein [Pirellulales bacterium]
MKKYACCIAAALCALALLGGAELRAADDDGWISLFNGKDLNGWKANENTDTVSVQDGEIVMHGPVCHLFYVGPVEQHDFKDFDFKAVVMTKPGSNSGIYFHTKYQDKGWPAQGFEVQVNNTHKDPKKTGGLYGVKDVFEAPAKDNEWFTEEISVRGTHVSVRVNGKEVVDWTEPADFVAKGFPGRKIGRGTFALQGHDPKSEVHYKSIEVRPVHE